MSFSERAAVRPLHAKALSFIHSVAEDKDPLWNEMNRAIKKGGLDYFAGLRLILSGKGKLFLCGFLWKKENGRRSESSAWFYWVLNLGVQGGKGKKCADLPEKTSTRSPGQGQMNRGSVSAVRRSITAVKVPGPAGTGSESPAALAVPAYTSTPHHEEVFCTPIFS
ncbi:hypothetical protein Entas_4575 (plasmid) [Enterobacter soli]|nr:hypothetical protein Entas_4575 [Enterobacter soli]